MGVNFPFSALVGQDQLKEAILIAAVDPGVGGVLILGDRGTGKSTAIRALAGLLPKIDTVKDCPYGCSPAAPHGVPGCAACDGGSVRAAKKPVPVVDLPLGVTEDRVVGALDLERALSRGERAFEPGLLAKANRGFLYIDEVNLLDDHIVDLLLDAAASGENLVEREGLSIRHPAKFVLIGSGNPEEGELRPQLLDRFGLIVSVTTPSDLAERVEVVKRRDQFERDPAGFVEKWKRKDAAIRRAILKARERLDDVEVPDALIAKASELCIKLGTDGLRGELALIRAARAFAAYEDQPSVGMELLRRVAPLALAHRLRRDPLDETQSTVRVERTIEEVMAVH